LIFTYRCLSLQPSARSAPLWYPFCGWWWYNMALF